MAQNTWTREEDDYLVNNYSTSNNKDIAKVVNKKLSTIKEYARRRGLTKSYDITEACRIGSFENLLKETPEAYYWIGFIFADGHLSEQGRLMITTAWDKGHLQKLADFIGSKVTTNKKAKSLNNFEGSRDIFYCVGVKDITRFHELKSKFDIHNRKTYNPPNLRFLNETWKLLAFLAGFIDGDGCISKSRSIVIQNHKSWLPTHAAISSMLSSISIYSSYKLASTGDSILYISNTLYDLIIKQNLPLMERKWSKHLK